MSVTEMNNAFREVMRAKSLEIRLAKLLKDAEDLASDWMGGLSVGGSDSQIVGALKGFRQNVLTNAPFAQHGSQPE